jgi:DNA-binding transcriptional LysR family regulator
MSRITLAQLEAFCLTATLGSVEIAAGRLRLAQPSVSLRLKSLAEAIGAPLFQRSGRGLRLTRQGHDLLLRAQQVLREVDGMIPGVDPADIRGKVRVGMAEGLALVCLPRVLDLVHLRHPGLELDLSVGTSAIIDRDLLANELDIAFLVSPMGQEGFSLAPLGVQETSWVAGPAWQLPDAVTPRDLIDLPIITNPPGSINWHQINGWFGSAGLTPARMDVCNSVSMLAQIVLRGAAIGILPVKAAEIFPAAAGLRVLHTLPKVNDTPIFAKFPSPGTGGAPDAVLAAVRTILHDMGYLDVLGA